MKRLVGLLASVAGGVGMTYLAVAAWSYDGPIRTGPGWLRFLSHCAALSGLPMWWAGYAGGAWVGLKPSWVAYVPFAFNTFVWASVLYGTVFLASRFRARRRDLTP